MALCHCKLYIKHITLVKGLLLIFAVNAALSSTPLTIMSTYWTTTSTITKDPAIPTGCSCTREDPYGVLWIIPGNETLVQPCPGVSFGNASWVCDYVNGLCQFHTLQPDYSKCTSLAVLALRESVMDNATDVTDIWIDLSSLTAKADGYFGQDIFNILEIVTLLLDRQQSEMTNSNRTTRALQRFLPLQINTTAYGAETMGNLISNDYQWDQLLQVNQADESLIKIVLVSDDVAFRLTNVAQSESKSLRCDFSSSNIVISSSYWNGKPSDIQDCGMTKSISKGTVAHSATPTDAFLRFPMFSNNTNPDDEDNELVDSYILLPEDILVPGKAYKASGVLIPLINRVKEILPGKNNKLGKEDKIVNSPLISYTLYDPDTNIGQLVQLPERTHVQLVYKHGVIAKYPPVSNIRRWLGEDEKESAVITSSLCSYLLLLTQKKNGSEDDSMLWTWDNRGCRVASTNRTHTVCRCDHLTGFANLMDFHRYIGPDPVLNATSMTCSILSIICLIITVVILTVLKSLRTHRTTLTQNLCVTLFISHLMTLITLDKHLLSLNEETCATMGIFLHFMFLASFMWMFIEGFQLYRMAINVFNVMTTKWTMFYIILAYSMPFLIVVITILSAYSAIGVLEVYSGDESCWLTGENWLWSFGAPVAITLLMNFVFLLIALRSSYHLQHSGNDKSTLKQIKKTTVRVVSLSCLLGLTWLTGFLLYSETTILAFIFTITNGLQGVSIFIDRCLLNVKIRTALLDGLKRFHLYLVSKWHEITDRIITNTREKNISQFLNRFNYPSTGNQEMTKKIQNKQVDEKSSNSSSTDSGPSESTGVSSTNSDSSGSIKLPTEQAGAQLCLFVGSDIKMAHQMYKKSSARVRKYLHTTTYDIDDIGNF